MLFFKVEIRIRNMLQALCLSQAAVAAELLRQHRALVDLAVRRAHLSIYRSIYIYIEREREIERERDIHIYIYIYRERERERYRCVYIYIYI